MSQNYENMQFCQSCAMPLQTDADKGTNADGSLNEEYCVYCYEKGALVGGDTTMEEMIEQCIGPCVESGVYPDADTARAEMTKFFPQLKRWREKA